MEQNVETVFGIEENKLEESAFSNSKGYFYLLTKCLAVSSEALISKDIIKETDSLYLLRRLLIGYFTDEELTAMNVDFQNIRKQTQEYYNYLQQKLDWKAQQKMNNVRILLDKIGDLISVKMHKSNLYTLLKEKGSFLYN
jgi:predicted nucleotidyltransferase